MQYFDKNGKELKVNDVIDIHQNVNGLRFFVIMSTDPLDIRYRYDLNRPYEYDKEDLLSPCKLTGEVDWEIIVNLGENIENISKNGTIYSKKQFPSYTHRFKVEFMTDAPYISNIDIYSDSDSREDLTAFIENKKNEKVKSFKIVHCASKEQDELTASLIDDLLADL